jgi:pyruvate,water dikinase
MVSVPPEDRKHFCLTDDEIITLAQWTMIIEDHYSLRAHSLRPMDIEWGKDGESGKLFILSVLFLISS